MRKKTVKAWAIFYKGWIFKIGVIPCIFKTKKEVFNFYPFGNSYVRRCTITIEGGEK